MDVSAAVSTPCVGCCAKAENRCTCQVVGCKILWVGPRGRLSNMICLLVCEVTCTYRVWKDDSVLATHNPSHFSHVTLLLSASLPNPSSPPLYLPPSLTHSLTHSLPPPSLCHIQNLEFEGIMRFYFQSNTKAEVQKVATKCIRVSNTANTGSVIEALVQKFRPDLRMLSSHSSYALYEVHSNEGKNGPFTESLSAVTYCMTIYTCISSLVGNILYIGS